MSLEHFDLHGKVAIVTGAAGEVGQVIVADLLRAGASVACVDRSRGPVKVQGSREGGAERVWIARCDVRSEQEVRRMVRNVIHKFGQVDFLVNNAAVRGPTVPAASLNTKAWQTVLDTNLTGAFLCARACLKRMMWRRQGRIINVASVAGRGPYPLRSSYAASKWGLVGFTLTLAQEVGAWNVLVNAVCPGPVMGAAMEQVMAKRARALRVSAGKIQERFLKSSALGRMVTPEDVSSLVLFLCSEGVRNITGQVIEVSGGFGMLPP
jgi:NAD(P)-dependent dehydrogenase (short-subunit alcohol dehydrogenase family)